MPRRSAFSTVSSRGFTMIEAIFVALIAGILAALAAPSFLEIIEGQRARSAATDLYISLTRTRSEAIKRNATVELEPKAGGWANGWQVIDATTNAVIEDHESLRNLTVTGPDDVEYLSSGRIKGSTAPTFQINGVYPSSTRCVSADLSGRPYIKGGSC